MILFHALLKTKSTKDIPGLQPAKKHGTERRIITSLDLDSNKMEQHNIHLQEKYKEIAKNETRFELIDCDDAEYIFFVAYGSSARIAQKAVKLARAKGLKVGLFRLITLFPFPSKQIHEMCGKGIKGFFSC